MTRVTQLAMESYTVDYTGLWLRTMAMAIDGAILGTIIWLFNGVWSLAFGRGWMGTAASNDASGVYWFFVILIPFLMVTGYFIGFWRWRGQTPGKMTLGIRIVRFNGDGIAFVPLLIGVVWIGFDTRRQGLHDKLAETYVIRGKPR